jgi:parvulin-like peptidyl-prolyl isomerase
MPLSLTTTNWKTAIEYLYKLSCKIKSKKKGRLMRKPLITSIAFLLLSLFILPGYGITRAERGKQTIAKVGKEKITLDQFEQKVKEKKVFSTNPTEDKGKKKDLLDEMILELLIKQKAEKTDLSGDEKFLQAKENYMSDQLLKLMYRKEISEQVQLTDGEIEKYYNENKEELFKIPEQVKASHILVRIEVDSISHDTAQAQKKAKQKAESIYQQVKAGADFGELAKEYSQDPGSKDRGGNLGFFPKGRMVKEFEEAAFSLGIGEMSEPVETQFGYHIIKVTDRKKEGYEELDSNLREELKNRLRSEREKQKAESYVKRLKEESNLVFNEQLLSKEDTSKVDSSWVLIVNQKDTIDYQRYKSGEAWFEAVKKKKDLSLEEKKEFLRDYLAVPLILKQEGKRKEYDQLPEYKELEKEYALKEAIKRIKSQNILKDYREPTDEEAKQYFSEHQADYPLSDSLHVYHIIFDDSAKAAQVLEQIKNGADFVQMAKQYFPAEEEIRDVVYDLKYISKFEMPEEFYDAASNLKVGEVSPPVKTKWGYHLIKLIDRKGPSSFEDIKNLVKNDMRNKAFNDHKAKWEEELKKGVKIHINQKVLDKYQLPSAQTL